MEREWEGKVAKTLQADMAGLMAKKRHRVGMAVVVESKCGGWEAVDSKSVGFHRNSWFVVHFRQGSSRDSQAKGFDGFFP